MMSMTGFGQSTFELGQHRYRIELRSVNNRFLDTKVRTPWVIGELEGRLLSLVKRTISRGHVDITITEDASHRGAGTLVLDQRVAQDLAQVLQQLSAALGADLSTAAQLVQPMRELVVSQAAQLGADQIWPQLEPGLKEALTHLRKMRLQEGEALAKDMGDNLSAVEQIWQRINGLAGEVPRLQRDRLLQRISRLQADGAANPERVEQEVAIFADRCDISEELSRLVSHVEQLRGMFSVEGVVGRKIEFMLQELNRELNTIASKSQSAEISHDIVEAKALAEKIREQAQNVE